MTASFIDFRESSLMVSPPTFMPEASFLSLEPPQEAPEARDARVAASGDTQTKSVGVRRHGTELDDEERPPVLSDALLAKQHGPAT